MKKFRIRKFNGLYKVDQRHTFLFFFHYWDDGAWSLLPNVLYGTKEDAINGIVKHLVEVES